MQNLPDYLNFNYLSPLLMAIAMGATIGLEREFHHKPAGLRTNILICMGGAVFTLIAKGIGSGSDAESRIIQGVVTGVGFLGAGVLIHQQTNVQGLTTAATVWLVTAIGIACGARLYALSITVTILALAVLLALHPVEKHLRKNDKTIPDHDNNNQV